MQYIGRFAPSPTGPLHFGSLVAAVASYCDARANQGKWLIRMEDVDKPREMTGAAAAILRTLETFGFAWDGEVVYQSQRNGMYAAAFNQLQNQQLIYACTCTRKEIADSSVAQGVDGLIYPSTCLNKPVAPPTMHAAYRVKVLDKDISFTDRIQGEVTQNLAHDIGDFILKRKDGLFAYQLAVVVDDAEQGITHIVRGADLLDSTPRQIYLQQLSGLATPHYAHVPVAVNANHEKLSKQSHAAALHLQNAQGLLYQALCFLGQQPPSDLQHSSVQAQLSWAIKYWQLNAIPSRLTIAI